MMGSRCWLSEMYYFNIRHTVIVMIFICYDTFNILMHDSCGIKNQEGRRYFQYRHFWLHYETVFEERLHYSSGQGGSFNTSVITNAELILIAQTKK